MELASFVTLIVVLKAAFVHTPKIYLDFFSNYETRGQLMLLIYVMPNLRHFYLWSYFCYHIKITFFDRKEPIIYK